MPRTAQGREQTTLPQKVNLRRISKNSFSPDNPSENLYSQFLIGECSNSEYPPFQKVRTKERFWYPTKFIQIIRFAEYPKVAYFLDNNSRRMYNTCEWLPLDKSLIVLNVQRSGLINRSQPINVTIKCTRQAQAPGLQRQKRQRQTVEQLVKVGFSANKFPATVLTLSFPTVKFPKVYTLEPGIGRFSIFQSSPLSCQPLRQLYLTIGACSPFPVDCEQLISATANAQFAFQ